MRGLIPLAAVGALAVAAFGSASAAPAQTRVIDRTVTCAIGLQGGLRSFTIQAQSRSAASSGYVWAVTNVQPTGRLATVGRSGFELSPFCRPTRTRVPLGSGGLQGSVAGPLGEEWDCEGTRSVLLRVRAVFVGRAPSLRRGDPWGFPTLFAHRPVREGALAIRTSRGRPLALARVLSTGKIQVFTSGSCFPD